MWKNVLRDTQTADGNIIWRTRFACWITTATDTHSEYVILIALPRQEWFRERATLLLLYVHACRVTSIPASDKTVRFFPLAIQTKGLRDLPHVQNVG